MTAEQVTSVRVAERRDLASGVVGLDLVAADGAPLPDWAPGAHVDLHLPGGLVRQYSLCGDPHDRWRWEVAVLREPDGRGGSACVHDKLAVDDALAVTGPRNHFPLVDAADYVFIAGGIGITPLLPMLVTTERAGRSWTLAYGGRTRASMAFRDDLARYGDRVHITPQDEYGLLDLDTVLAGIGPNTAVYCCGPEALLQAVEMRCLAEPLHIERFAPRAEAADSVDNDFEVVLASSDRVVPVPAGCSILAALEAAGVDVLSSCQEGTCGTCETAVLDGIPQHRDSVLTRAEQAEGDVMMICVSRAATPRLVLDL
jgi:ferredoxin-NADP reductase